MMKIKQRDISSTKFMIFDYNASIYVIDCITHRKILLYKNVKVI